MPGMVVSTVRRRRGRHGRRKPNQRSSLFTFRELWLVVGIIVVVIVESTSHNNSGIFVIAFSSPSTPSNHHLMRVPTQPLQKWCSMGCATTKQPGRSSLLRAQHFSSSSPSTDDPIVPSDDHLPTNSGLILPSHPDFHIRSVMAPMVAASDYPFRYFLRKHCGVDLTYTQMLHAKNFVTGPKFRSYHLDLFETGTMYPKLHPSQLECLEGLPIPDMEHYREVDEAEGTPSAPVIVQLAGNDANLVVQAAMMALEHTEGRLSGIDLNLGCPQGIARKGNYGAFLAENDFGRVCHILTELRKALPESTAVSAKIRLPENDATLKERIPRLVDTGINFLTVHGRTIRENKTKVGPCHVDRIRLAIETAQKVVPHFPVVANGGMEDYHDVQDILKRTGAVAAMSSEALLETPNLFQRPSTQLSPRERLNQQLSFARDYLHICATVVPPVPGTHTSGGSFGTIQSHLFKFLHRYLQEQQDLRVQMVEDTRNIVQALSLVDQLEARYSGLSNEELADRFESSSPLTSWYRRHRQPDRRVHQKEVKLVSSVSPFSQQPREEMTIEDRKKQILERIATMKREKETKAQKMAGTRLP